MISDNKLILATNLIYSCMVWKMAATVYINIIIIVCRARQYPLHNSSL